MDKVIEVGCAWCRWNVVKVNRVDYINSIKNHDEGVFGGYVCDPCRDEYDYKMGTKRLLEAVLKHNKGEDK